MNSYDLDGRRWIVTGGAGGIGMAIARRALADGARVSLWDRSADGLERASANLDADDRVIRRVVDITDEDAVESAMSAEVAAGRVDALINSAGILGEVRPLWETTSVDFRRVIEVNLVGAYLCLRAALGIMRRQALAPLRGHIVSVASIQGKEGMAQAGAYSASKAGLISLTKTAAKEAAQFGIVVTCIAPSAADTPMAAALTPERRGDILGRIPVGRFVDLDEIARMTAFLASGDCSFSTGAVFDLSGGRATY